MRLHSSKSWNEMKWTAQQQRQVRHDWMKEEKEWNVYKKKGKTMNQLINNKKKNIIFIIIILFNRENYDERIEY